VCELLKTVSLLKSEYIKEKTNPKKLITTKISCKNENPIILSSSSSLLFKKFLIEKKNIGKETTNPKINE
jgi:hypothetical protein